MTNEQLNHYLANKEAIDLYIDMKMVLEPNSEFMIPILNFCKEQSNIIDTRCSNCLIDALIYFRYEAKKAQSTKKGQTESTESKTQTNKQNNKTKGV